ncbi:hypothetical protein RN001_005709 [Aquatica leii]|uniref:Regulatory protein zeste n=1 Tax=Aquatica leii TaxID=1421715 RepID=A0AAN7SS42_9COLE|nr:hypothetical protein RN001_005709 [Aquatica leii]
MHFLNNENSDSEDERSVNKKSGINTKPSTDSMTTKNQLKGPHTIYSFDNWTILSAESQIDERIEHYKRLLEEIDQRIQTRDELIITLQNQLKKFENMCQKAFENTEHYRFKYEELSKITELKKESHVQCTQVNLNKTNIQEDLDSLKQQCSGIENLLQTQNNTIEHLISNWIKEFARINKQSSDSANITDEILNNIRVESATQNESLQLLLNENKVIRSEVLNLKQQILEIPALQTVEKKTSNNDCNCQNKSRKKFITDQDTQTDIQSNEFNETTINNLHQTMDTIQNEKLNITVKYEDMCKSYSCTNSKLQNKTLQLNTAIDEIKKLEAKISELQLMVETLNRENENCVQSETNTKLAEFENMQQLLQQYKEQVEFKKLENEKLRKKEHELQLELQKKEDNAAQIEKERSADALQLQIKINNLTNEYKTIESKLAEATNLIELKNKEIENLEFQTSALNKNFENEVKKVEIENNKSLTEISVLFKSKENECFEISHKFKEQEIYLANLEYENSDLKRLVEELQQQLELGFGSKDVASVCPMCHYKRKSFNNLQSQLIFLLHNIELLLIQALEEGDYLNLPPNTLDDFLYQDRKFIAILEQRKHVDITTKTSNAENSVSIKHSHDLTSNIQNEETMSLGDDNVKNTSLWTAIKQMVIELEDLKKQLNDNTKESFKHEYAPSSNPPQAISIATSETNERNLDIIEEELNNHFYRYQIMDIQKRRKLSDLQKQCLSEFLGKNPSVKSGKFTSSFTYKTAQRMWQMISEQLNAIGPVQKNWCQWRKTWQDIKAKTKSKEGEL